jgi:hypothetical protein
MGWVQLGIALAALAISLYTMYRAATMSITTEAGKFDLTRASEGSEIGVLFGRKTIKDVIVVAHWNARTESINVQNGVLVPDEAALGIKPPGYEYFLSMHLAVCMGKIDEFIALYWGDQLVWSGSVADDREKVLVNTYAGLIPGGGDGLYGRVQFRNGIDTATTAAEAGATDHEDCIALGMNVSEVPKFYGVASAVFDDMDFGISPNIKPIGVTCERMLTTNGGLAAQWYVEKVAIEIGRGMRGVWKYKLETDFDDGEDDYILTDFDDSSWTVGSGAIGNAPPGFEGNKLPEMENYWVPPVITQITDPTFNLGTSRSPRVLSGMKIWMRADLGPLPVSNMGVMLHHDDGCSLWFNETAINTTMGLVDMNRDDRRPTNWSKFNTSVKIPASLINPDGPNVVVYRVRDAFDGNGTHMIGNSRYIFAGIEIGPSVREPECVRGMNPAHMIHQVYTDEKIGMGYNATTDVDEASFTAMADTLYDEHFGLNLYWNKAGTSAMDFITEVLRHVGGVCYQNRRTGKLVVKLLRGDYDEEDLDVLDETHISEIRNAKREVAGAGYNSLALTYIKNLRGTEGVVKVWDAGGLQAAGREKVQKVHYPGINDPVIANQVAWRDLQMMMTPLWSFEITGDRYLGQYNKGDVIKVTWGPLQFSELVVRVLEVDLGNSSSRTVTLKVVEDIFATPSTLAIVPDDPDDPVVPPSGPSAPQSATTFHTAHITDPDDYGQVVCCYTGLEACGGEHLMFVGWTEGPAGTWTRDLDGPLDYTWFDGVDPDAQHQGVASWMLNRTVFATGNHLSSTNLTAQGLYVIDDIGGHYVNNGTEETPSWSYVETFAKMHRHPDYDTSADFVEGMTFQIQTGNTFGTDFISLASTTVILGTTEMDWNWTSGPTYAWDETYELVTPTQLAQYAFYEDEWATWTTGSAHEWLIISPTRDAAFTTLEGTPNVTKIPAGPWIMQVEEYQITGASAGSTTVISFRLEKQVGVMTSEILFDKATGTLNADGAVHSGETITYYAPEFAMGKGYHVTLTLCCSTDSTTPIVLSVKYNSPQHGTYVRIPVAVSTTTTATPAAAADEDYSDVTITNGVIAGFGSHRKLRVHGSGTLLAIETAGQPANPRIDCLFKDAVTITADATGIPATTAAIKCASGLALSADSSAQITLEGTPSVWRIISYFGEAV